MHINWVSSVLIVAAKAFLSIWLYRKSGCPGSFELALGYAVSLAIDIAQLTIGLIMLAIFEVDEVIPAWHMYWDFFLRLGNVICMIIVLIGFWKLLIFVGRSLGNVSGDTNPSQNSPELTV